VRWALCCCSPSPKLIPHESLQAVRQARHLSGAAHQDAREPALCRPPLQGPAHLHVRSQQCGVQRAVAASPEVTHRAESHQRPLLALHSNSTADCRTAHGCPWVCQTGTSMAGGQSMSGSHGWMRLCMSTTPPSRLALRLRSSVGHVCHANVHWHSQCNSQEKPDCRHHFTGCIVLSNEPVMCRLCCTTM
jgi:hypothetical protein